MRRERSVRGLAVSLESEIVNTGPVEGDVELAQMASDVADAQTAVVESEQVGDVLQVQIDDAHEAATDLGELQEIAEAAGEEGGLDRPAAQVLEVAVESICARAGISTQSISMPSVESFGGRSSRVGATALAVEGIGDQIKKIWEAIVKAMKKAYEWIKGHWLKVFGGYERLEKRAAALEKKASETTGKATNTKIDDGELYKKLATSKGVFQADDAVNLKEVVADVLKDAKENSEKEGKLFLDLSTDAQKKANGFSLSGDAPYSSMTATKDIGEAGNGMKWMKTGELSGGLALYWKGPEKDVSGVEAIEAFGKVKFKLDKFNPKANAPTQTSLPVLATGDCETIAKAIKDAASEMVVFRKEAEKLEKLAEDASKAAEKLADQALKGDLKEAGKKGPGEKDIFTALRGACANYVHATVGGMNAMMGYGFGVGKAALDYVEKSLGEYKAS